MNSKNIFFKYDDGNYFCYWDAGCSTQYYSLEQLIDFHKTETRMDAHNLWHAIIGHYLDEYIFWLKDGKFIDENGNDVDIEELSKPVERNCRTCEHNDSFCEPDHGDGGACFLGLGLCTPPIENCPSYQKIELENTNIEVPEETEDNTEVPEWIKREIKDTWNAMQGVGQLTAYRIMERMVRRLGYGDMRDESLAISKEM